MGSASWNIYKRYVLLLLPTISIDAPLAEKLASSRGPGDSAIIAPQQHLLSKGKGKNEAERKDENRDNHVASDIHDDNRDKIKRLDISDPSEEKHHPQQRPTNLSSNKKAKTPNPLSPFASCKEFLAKSSSNQFSSASESDSKISSSRSVSNLRSCLVEEKACLTDVHCGASGRKLGEDLYEDEVEIVSLLEEQIPRYKLRADTLTQFSGYANEDFVGVPYPALKDYSPVTPEQAYLTLGYFLLSGERVSQMTKTYADADALQKLLEEKEKDLELAARIGQQLLEQNRILEEKVAVLQADNKDNVECITQLKHDLSFKNQLLELYNESPDSPDASKSVTPMGTVASMLERRVGVLEEENKVLRGEAARMAEDVEKTEAEERYLVQDAIAKLSDTNARLTVISDDLQKKSEESAAQQEELMMLAEEAKSFQETNQELLEENIELQKLVDELKVCRDELSTELVEMKDNYVEVVSLLKETQDQLRDAQQKKDSGADVVSVFDSLAYEIESSVARQRRTSDYFRRTFDTVRLANHKMAENALASSALMSSASSSGYISGSSGLPSLECSQDAMNLSNSTAASLALSGSDLGSSLCLTPAGSTPGSWKLPEKLQIVKPLEGSSTLGVWSALATPHLGNLLENRPGVQMRVERSVGEIGMQTLLSLTGGEDASVLPNVVSTPAVFTFVTTTNSKDRSETTTTVFSATVATSLSSGSGSSVRSVYSRSSPQPSPIVTSMSLVSDPSASRAILPSSSTRDSGVGLGVLLCETPKNSPVEGNTRPGSPNLFRHREGGDEGDGDATSSQNRTMKKTLYSFYDTLCSKLVRLGSPSSRNLDYVGSHQKYDLTTKLGRVEVAFESSRFRAPVKPGTGALEKFLAESDA